MLMEFLRCGTLSLPYVALGLLLSLVFTYILIFLLPRLGFVDIPRGRHQHAKPIPKGGGVAIAVSFVFTVFMVYLNPELSTDTAMFLRKFLIPAGIIFVVGILDDRYELRSWTKLFAQIVTGAVIYFENGGISRFFAIPLPAPIALVVTVVWCIVIINAFNLIDGRDGIAAG